MNAQKIKLRQWIQMPLHKKTETYFAMAGVGMHAQTMFHNDWRKAFEWFEDNYTTI